MSRLTLLCRSASTFAPGGGFDEAAHRQFLQQFIEARLGIYVGSAGSGEGLAMTADELRRMYRSAVAECKGKIPVNANPPEAHTARMAIEHSQLAADAGIEVVNIYGPAGWHGYTPTDAEFLAYYDQVFAAFRHPTAIAPNPLMGYTPSPSLIAKVADRHGQVVAINLAGQGDAYFIELKNALKRKVDIYVPYNGSMEALALGATGLLGAEANIVPNTFRRYLDCYSAGDIKGAAGVYGDLHRLTHYLKPWHHGSPKWIKMFMKAFKRPGGEGGLREPYRMPDEAEIRRFVDGLLRLDIAEINQRASAAGLAPSL